MTEEIVTTDYTKAIHYALSRGAELATARQREVIRRNADPIKIASNKVIPEAFPVPEETPVKVTPKEPIPTIDGRPPAKVAASKLLSGNIHPLLQGTKLAADLIYARDKFGKHDPELKKLATKALARAGATSEDYTEIGRRLLQDHAAPEATKSPALVERQPKAAQTGYRQHAHQIAKDYNWKNIANKLDLDDLVHEFVTKVFSNDKNSHQLEDGRVVKFTDHLNNDSHLRAAHNFFGGKSENRRNKYGVNDIAHQAFRDKLRDFINRKTSGVGASVKLGKISDQDLEQSMLRLAKGEANRANIAKDKVEEGVADPTYAANPHEFAAWTKASNGRQIRHPDAHSWQFSRDYEEAIKYSIFEPINKVAEALRVPHSWSPSELAKKAKNLVLGVPEAETEISTRRKLTSKANDYDVPVDDKVNRRKDYDGIVHNATLSGGKGINPYNYKAAHIEQAAVGKALDAISETGLPANHGKIQEYIKTIRELLTSPKGKEKLGPTADQYLEHAATLPEKYPFKGEIPLLRSAKAGQRVENTDVNTLAELLKPMLRGADSHLHTKRYKEAKETNAHFDPNNVLPPDPSEPSPFLPDRSFGWGKNLTEAAPVHEEDYPDFNLDLPEVTKTNPDIEEIEATPKLQSPDEMLAAAQARLAEIKDSGKIPLAKKKKGGQFKKLLKNYGIEETPTEVKTKAEDAIPVVKGKVKKLPPIRQSREGEVAKYSPEEEAGFHSAIEANPEENTNSLVYADWLTDNGKPATASVIRKHMKTYGGAGVLNYPLMAEKSAFMFTSDGARKNPTYSLTLNHRSPKGGAFVWKVHDLPKTEAINYAKTLEEEGHHPVNLPTTMSLLDSPQEADKSKFNRNDYVAQYAKASKKLTAKDVSTESAPIEDNSEAGFHKAIVDNPDEKTNGIAYADWLRENGKPAHADIIENHLNHQTENGRPMNTDSAAVSRNQDGNSWPFLSKHKNGSTLIGVTPVYKHKDGNFIPSGLYDMVLSKLSGDKVLKWFASSYPAGEAAALTKALVNEGVETFGDTAKAFAKTDKVNAKYARAGTGGLIISYGDINGKYSPGGRFVEKLGTEAPKKKKRKNTIKQKLKKHWSTIKGFTTGAASPSASSGC